MSSRKRNKGVCALYAVLTILMLIIGYFGGLTIYYFTHNEGSIGVMMPMAQQETPVPTSALTPTPEIPSSSAPVPTVNDSTLNIREYNLPPDQSLGDIFGIKGIITSNFKILSVTVAVYDYRGVAETSRTVYPDANSYDICSIDLDVLFDILTVGEKIYEVSATDEIGEKTLLSSSFEVFNKPESTITPLSDFPSSFYSVQLGSFSTYDNALNLYNELARAGYDVYLSEGANQLLRVHVGVYYYRYDAQELLEIFIAQGFGDAFIIRF